MLFTGRYKHKIDANGRISIPSSFRDKLNTGSSRSTRRHHGLFLVPSKVTKAIGNSSFQPIKPLPVILCIPEEVMSIHNEKILDALPKYLKVDPVAVFEVARQVQVTEEGRIHLPLPFTQHLMGGPNIGLKSPAMEELVKYVDLVGWGIIFAIEWSTP